MATMSTNEKIILEMYEDGKTVRQIQESGRVLNRHNKPISRRYIQMVLKEHVGTNRPMGRSSRAQLFTYEEVLQMFKSKSAFEKITKRRFREHYIKRGNSIKRARLALTVLSRDGFQCQTCGSYVDLECHHESYEFNNTKEEANHCITLCKECHIKIKSR